MVYKSLFLHHALKIIFCKSIMNQKNSSRPILEQKSRPKNFDNIRRFPFRRFPLTLDAWPSKWQFERSFVIRWTECYNVTSGYIWRYWTHIIGSKSLQAQLVNVECPGTEFRTNCRQMLKRNKARMPYFVLILFNRQRALDWPGYAATSLLTLWYGLRCS